MILHSHHRMNRLSTMLVVLAICALLYALVYRILHSAQFNLRAIVIQSDTKAALQHVHTADILANLRSNVSGNFFTINLDKVRQALLNVPWVRQVSIHRVWPNALAIEIEEHIPQAVWQDKEHRYLVNNYGEIFRVHPNDSVVWQRQQQANNALIYLVGPENGAQQMLVRQQQIQNIFAALKWRLTTLSLSQRYAWSAMFDNGIKIYFGQDEHKPNLETRAKQFVQALPQVMQIYPTKLVYADLRYSQGFAVRFGKENNDAMKRQFIH